MSDTVPTSLDRDAINTAFAKAHSAAVNRVHQSVTDLCAAYGSVFAFVSRKALLDNILSTVPTIGTPEFQETDIHSTIFTHPEFNIRIDWPIVLLAWYAAWAHNAIVDPGESGQTLARALEILNENVTNGARVDLSWEERHEKVSAALERAILTELRDMHKLVGPWRVTGVFAKSTIALEAKVPHCGTPFQCTFSAPIVYKDGAWQLESAYNAELESAASNLERHAAEIVEHAVRDSMPFRTQAASIRARMTKKAE